MEINGYKIEWDKWYVQIGGLILLRFVATLFTYAMKTFVVVMLNFIIALTVLYWIYRGIDKTNNKLLKKCN